ncbi:MAG: SDR family oxidoreductase [Anaerolineae bacterium]|nr:MAG: SDR family oxidoreductase [Anaerolineae bacterium]
MKGKVCMVTGATSGMGVVTAQALARQGATVIVIGRSREKGIATVSQIRQQTGNPAVELLVADLSSQSEVRQLAQVFTSQHERLDVLINNAGAIFARRQETIDGIEVTLALNHLACFLLTNLLLHALKASAPTRIINVSSFAHKLAKIRFTDLQGKRRYVGWQVYAQSKLANLLFTYELARRLEGTGVTVNALDPGLVATNFGLSEGGVVNLFKRLFNPLALSPEEGARTSIYLATSPHVEGISGEYFVNCRPVKSSQASYDRTAANRLWRVSAELTGLCTVM